MPKPKAGATGHEFPGRLGRTREESTPHWKVAPNAAAGSPNVVIIYMDDMGFSDVGCFGSEVSTPHIDALAARGQRFNHYTTHPICSSARAALLTGRNAHAVGAGWLTSNDPGFPGYSGRIPLSAPTLPETFRAAGYATIGVGKWHNAVNRAQPNNTWPTQRGFDRFYGVLEGEVSYFFPANLVYNNMLAPVDQYPEGYYTTDDWTAKALMFMREVRNERAAQPFLLYLAYNAVHAPLQAKKADLRKYRGRYDAGWDVLREQRLERQKVLGLVPRHTRLAPRDPSVPAWHTLSESQRALYSRHMEAYAAMLDCVDQNVGAIVAQLQDMGELENTIIMFASDNGGTGAGGPDGAVFNGRRFAGLAPQPVELDMERIDWIGTARAAPLYPTGWAQVSNTPFPLYKTYTGGGGRRVGMILSWPRGMGDQGGVRSEFFHVTDVMPTLMELSGVPALQKIHGESALPMDGKSLAATVLNVAPGISRSEQYFECWANRAYWQEGWVAVSVQKRGEPINFNNWTLHEQDTDFSESVDVAALYPQRLADMVRAFDSAAWANHVYPLDNRLPIQKFNELPPHLRPPEAGQRRFLADAPTVMAGTILPMITDRSFRIMTRIRHEVGDEGVLFAIGDIYGGMVLYLESGQLHLFYNGFGDFSRIPGVPLAAGKLDITLAYEALGRRTGRGRIQLGETPITDWVALSPTMTGGFLEGLDIGIDRRAPVDWELFQRRGCFRYTGTIFDLTIYYGTLAPDSPFASLGA